MEISRRLLVILQLIFVWLYTPVFVEDVITVKNVTYSSNCWLDFKRYNISCSHIDISINETVVADADHFIQPITKLNRSEGFKVAGCQTTSVRCYKDGVETHYKAQGTEDAKSNKVKEEGGDGTGDWKIWVAVAVPVFLFLVCSILGLIYCRKAHCQNKHHLPFYCVSRMKDPIEDPAATRSLCESQDTLQLEQPTGRTPNPRFFQGWKITAVFSRNFHFTNSQKE
ncbi:uncharacterized protein LOC132380549 [Hypanus sabinus]|uniref:uncharacterized protein LOC132380549 n=1 Tax=Hypanus sabinus TaxID=79690 RepID=UPI0028C456DC|nr:uncharacterized protein LOC132380549 [Hypanus sabinus]